MKKQQRNGVGAAAPHWGGPGSSWESPLLPGSLGRLAARFEGRGRGHRSLNLAVRAGRGRGTPLSRGSPSYAALSKRPLDSGDFWRPGTPTGVTSFRSWPFGRPAPCAHPPSSSVRAAWASRRRRGADCAAPRRPVPTGVTVWNANRPWHHRLSVMILPQVHLRKPCYDFYFL